MRNLFLAVSGVAMILASLAGVAAIEAPGQSSSPALPAGLERYLAAEVHPTAEQRAQLLAGRPVSKRLPSDESKEIFVFGAVWIAAPASDYVRSVKDIESFEKGGGFRITKKISDPPVLADFAALELPAEDLEDLKHCKVGDCELKIGARGFDALKKEVRWGTPNEKADADGAIRRIALEYVQGYREGGNARLAVYRDSDRPVFVANEFKSMIERAPSLVTMPDLQKYLLEYPTATLPGSTDFLYWQEAEFGLKPTIRINHLVIQDRPGGAVVASKMLYASHYFWTALEQRVLIPDPSRGAGFWFVMVSRSRSDGLNGFVGRVIRGRVQSEATKGTEAALTVTKDALEGR